MSKESFATCIMLIVLVGMLWSLVSPKHSYACSCGIVSSPTKSFELSESVFMGTATAVRDAEPSDAIWSDWYQDDPDGSGWGLRVFEFRVQKVWKGPERHEIMLMTQGGSGSWSCGKPAPNVGGTYIVYASETYIVLCDRMQRLDEAAVDLAFLGPGQVVPASTPTKVPTIEDAEVGTNGCGTSAHNVDLGMLLVMGGVIGLAWQKRHTRC